MSFKLRLLAACPLIAIAGCMTPSGDIASPDPAFGEAVKYDMAIQVIDPDPVYDEDGAQPGDNGEVAQKAVERYRKGQNLRQHNREARQGSALSTTGDSSGSGSGSGSGPQ